MSRRARVDIVVERASLKKRGAKAKVRLDLYQQLNKLRSRRLGRGLRGGSTGRAVQGRHLQPRSGRGLAPLRAHSTGRLRNAVLVMQLMHCLLHIGGIGR